METPEKGYADTASGLHRLLRGCFGDYDLLRGCREIFKALDTLGVYPIRDTYVRRASLLDIYHPGFLYVN